MSFLESLANGLTKFGKNNSPTVVAIGIAAAKGVFRPIFTMMDTKESPKTKKYTAFREGLTELIAIPVYYTGGVIAKYCAKKLANPRFFMSNEAYKAFKSGVIPEHLTETIKHAQKLATENLPKISTNATFAGVCLSALFFIPLICSATIKPIMKALKMEATQNKQQTTFPNVSYTSIKAMDKKNLYHNFLTSVNNGMKVGGV